MGSFSQHARKAVWALSALAGVPLLYLAWQVWQRSLHDPVGSYDEGLLLTNAFLIGRGFWPFRDFFTPYPPGTFLLLKAAWVLFGETVNVERALGLAANAAVVLLTGRVVGRAVGRRFSLLASGSAAAWWTFLAPGAFAWLFGLAAALGAIELSCVAVERRRPRDWALAGLAAAAIGFFRHDLLVYFTLAALAVLGAWAVVDRAALRRDRVREAAVPFLGAFVGACIVFWGPLLVVGGPSRIVHDLYLDMVRYVMPRRVLPLPELSAWKEGWPVVLTQPFEAAVAWVLAGPALGAAAILAWRKEPSLGARLAVGLLGALAAAVIPQATGRTDLGHAAYSVVPALALLVALTHKPRPWPLALLGLFLAVALIARPLEPLRKVVERPVPDIPTVDPRLKGIPFSAAHQALVADLRRRTAPDERIFVGQTSHLHTMISEMDIYFYAQRAGGIRRMHFDPGISNQEWGMKETIAELERNGVRVAVRSPLNLLALEENESRKPGSPLLDAYFAQHFAHVAQYGPYEVWQRVPR